MKKTKLYCGSCDGELKGKVYQYDRANCNMLICQSCLNKLTSEYKKGLDDGLKVAEEVNDTWIKFCDKCNKTAFWASVWALAIGFTIGILVGLNIGGVI